MKTLNDSHGHRDNSTLKIDKLDMMQLQIAQKGRVRNVVTISMKELFSPLEKKKANHFIIKLRIITILLYRRSPGYMATCLYRIPSQNRFYMKLYQNLVTSSNERPF